MELRLSISTRNTLEIKSRLEEWSGFLLAGLFVVLLKAIHYLSEHVGLADNSVTKRRWCMIGQGVEGLSEISLSGVGPLELTANGRTLKYGIYRSISMASYHRGTSSTRLNSRGYRELYERARPNHTPAMLSEGRQVC